MERPVYAGPTDSMPGARLYPPLSSLVVGLLLAILTMPSTLDVPQRQPSQTLEFAPVPPEGDGPPVGGALDRLGHASSRGIDGGGPGGDEAHALPPALPGASGDNVSQYRCVEGRQTEDPLSPPCVAFFDGDNFGPTHAGVTGDEVDVLVYFDGGIRDHGGSRGSEAREVRTYYDLVEDPPDPKEHVYVRMMRGWQKYFNTRYQTYGRFVHFHLYFSDYDRSAETRRSEAAENFERVGPFGVIVDAAFDGGGDAYLDTMLGLGAMNFGSFVGQSAGFYRRYPSLLWGFLPSLEIQATQFGELLCRKYVGDPAAPNPVDHSPSFSGQPRKFGLVYTTDAGFEGLRSLKDRVVERFGRCGGTIAEEATFPAAGFVASANQSPSYAAEAMAEFAGAGVTTIIWPGGLETNFTKAAGRLGYQPEWAVLGDGHLDAEFPATFQDQAVWANAVVMSNQTFVPADTVRRLCVQAYRSVDRDTPVDDIDRYGCRFYDSLRQLFTGIQVAGPRLGPASVDQGFHAIPAIASDNAQVPACFYLPNDYTCIKDLVVSRYDPAGRPGSPSPGCFRFAETRRYLTSEIPDGNATAQMSADDPCLGYDAPALVDQRPPSDPGDL